MAKISFIFLLLLVAPFFELAAATNICTWGFYMCASNSQCISSRNRCDGSTQCTYGEDERNCPSRCTGYYSSYFKCSNNTACISRNVLCNGVNDCTDGSDETTALCGGTAFRMRLVGGRSSNEGRVEVYHSPTASWGTICDDEWDIYDAKVVCRQLGLPRATYAVGSARFGQGSGPIMLDNVQCTGSELTLSKCSSGGWKTHDCIHSEDAGVICGGGPLPSPTGTRANSCSWGNFYCSTSNQCKSSQWRCDGGNDCRYGEDERSCPIACPTQSSYFRCNNLRCIRRTSVCDGDNDCGDNSDESSYLCGVRTTGTRLRCYSCSSSTSSCYTTSCSFYSGYGYCYRKTYDRTWLGSTTRVTVAGCRSSCSTSFKTTACSGLSNCRMSCCRTSLCNSASSTTDSSYPSCYTCTSTSSYKDCEKKAKLTRCSSTAASCYKMDYKVTTSYAEASLYSKGCTTSYACSQMKSTNCRTSYTDCNVYCCKGNKCNAGSIQRFSVVVLVTCAVAFLVLG